MLVAGLGIASAFPADSSAGSWFSMQSQPGDYIGSASSWGPYVHGQNATITANGDGNAVHVSIQGAAWWNVDFAAPAGQQLAVGTYVDAQRYPFHPPGRPGLSVSGDGRGCNRLSGRFTVTDVAFGPNSTVTRFHATFVQYCEYSLSALSGEIAFNVDAPPAPAAPPPALPGNTWLSMSSEPGDWVGQGQSWGPYVLLENAKFDASYGRGEVRIFVDSGSEWWSLQLAAPEGQPLTPGTYEGAMRSSSRPLGAPGMDVSGTGRGCNTLTGRFVVTEAAFKDTGEVERFHATFEQHCENAPPGLFGEIAIMATARPLGCQGSRATIIGTPNADTLTGTEGHNVIVGLGGNDTINGLGGHDLICGGAGNDILRGSEGHDGLQGGPGNDFLYGGPGLDRASYEDAQAAVGVNLGNMDAWERFVDADAQIGYDTLPDESVPADGSDIETVIGSNFNDTLSGSLQHRTHNNFYGLAGNDIAYGYLGHDWMDGGPGADSFHGGADLDGVSYFSRTNAVKVTLGDGYANDGEAGEGDQANADGQVENVNGGQGFDTFTGNGSPNTFYGQGGNDVASGLAGDDWFDPGPGQDSFSGGEGSDGVSYFWRTNLVTVTLDTIANDGEAGEGDQANADGQVENVNGGKAGDILTGNALVNKLFGQSGNDDLRSRDAVQDSVFCGEGADSVTADNLDTAAADCETVARG